MANPAYLKSLFGGLDAPIRRVLDQLVEYLLANLRFGRPEHNSRAENHQLYFYEARTPGTPNQEFSIPHGLGRVPYLIIPVLPLHVGAQFVRLSIPRAPDASRVYLASPETDAPVTILMEG